MAQSLLVVHGGAATAVINASLYGVICEALESDEIGRVLGARHGTGGLLKQDFIDLGVLPAQTLGRLPYTPGSAIGTSRDHLEPEDYQRMVQILRDNNIGLVAFNGGNGSMEACGKLAEACKGTGIRSVGIPKTIDNDIAVTDHAPGYGSAARFVAQTVADIAQDLASLPIHVCVMETMGREAGWLAAAATLSQQPSGAPHVVCMPERAFHEDEFLQKVQDCYRKHGGVLVVVSEELRDANNQSIVPPVFKANRSTYYADTSAYLSGLIIRRLGIKARNEKPGIAGRASIAHQSDVDREEAIRVGREAVRALLGDKSEVMIGLSRRSGEQYGVDIIHIPIGQVMLHERVVPGGFIGEDNLSVDKSFRRWCQPLVGNLEPRLYL